jgi:tetratricopeptide (TPR) repeat protein
VGDLVFVKFGQRRGTRHAVSALDHYDRGCALEATDPAAAMAAYRRALASRPDLADAHNNLGRLHHDAGDLATAEACYRRAIELTSEVGLYWFNLGVALEDQGRDPVAAYERAVQLDPRLPDAHFNLARQIERKARSTGDELMLRRAVRHLKQYRDLAG